MTGALPPGNRGDRNGATRGKSRCGGFVLGAFRLVRRNPVPPEREKPPRRNPGGQCGQIGWFSAFDRVGALPVFAFRGRHGQPHFLTDRAGQDPRTECGCQPVAFCRSLAVAPPVRFSRSRI